jgi:hypothetical protein
MLGHRRLASTEKYVLRGETMNPDYENLKTHTDEEAEHAIQAGFEYVKDHDGVSHWRRPK